MRVFNRSNLILLISREKNKKQKAINVIIKESFIGQDMLRPRLVIMTGWIVLHNLMEKNVIGTLIKPMIPKTADRFARWFSFTDLRSIRYATYVNHKINVVVNLGSHVHQTFQTGFAQMGPVIKTMVQNMTPVSTAQ